MPPVNPWDKIHPILARELGEHTSYILQAEDEAYANIQLDPSFTLEERKAFAARLEAIGGRIMFISTATPYVAAFVPKTSVLPIAALPEVVYVWHTPHVHTQELVPEGTIHLLQLTRVTMDAVRARLGITGSGNPVDVGVVDSGIDPALRAWVVEAESYVDNEPYLDQSGHGTAVCSAIVSMNPAVRLHMMKVFREDEGDVAHAMEAMEQLAVNRVPIVNASFGAESYPPVDELVSALHEKYGTLFIVAAGNSGCDGCIMSPAASPDAVAVGSVTFQDPQPYLVSTFSSRGPAYGAVKPDFASFGGGDRECIVLAAAGSRQSACWKGTSFASPLVAGLLSLYYGGDTHAALSLMEQHTLTIDASGKDNLVGLGVPFFRVPGPTDRSAASAVSLVEPPNPAMALVLALAVAAGVALVQARI